MLLAPDTSILPVDAMKSPPRPDVHQYPPVRSTLAVEGPRPSPAAARSIGVILTVPSTMRPSLSEMRTTSYVAAMPSRSQFGLIVRVTPLRTRMPVTVPVAFVTVVLLAVRSNPLAPTSSVVSIVTSSGFVPRYGSWVGRLTSVFTPPDARTFTAAPVLPSTSKYPPSPPLPVAPLPPFSVIVPPAALPPPLLHAATTVAASMSVKLRTNPSRILTPGLRERSRVHAK